MTNPTEEVKLPEPEGYFATTDDGRWVEAPEGADRSRLTPLYGKAALQAQAAEHAAQVRRIRDIRNENAEDDRTEIRLCRKEISGLRADAERYRFARLGSMTALLIEANGEIRNAEHRYRPHELAMKWAEKIDAAIDAARQTTREQP